MSPPSPPCYLFVRNCSYSVYINAKSIGISLKCVCFCSAPPAGTPAHGVWTILDGDAQFRLFHASVTSVEPDPNFVILTDEFTPFDATLPRVDVQRSAINHSEVMLERTRRQSAFLNADPLNKPVVFFDTDMLLLEPISPLFERDFDIALTLRPSGRMPVNGGLIFINNRRPDLVRQFFQSLKEYIETEAQGQKREWYGDQIALAAIVGEVNVTRDRDTIRDINGLRILFLDAARYNYSPNRDHPVLWSNLSGISLYHFKGRCRIYMRDFWTKRINPRRGFLDRFPLTWLMKGLWLDLKRKKTKSVFFGDTRRL